ncbi:solute carrier family 22 member 7 [Discoglossus pictus]
MRFEDILLEVGVFGKFQIVSLLILCLPRVILPLHFLLHIFISAVPHHHCATPTLGQSENLSREDLLLVYIPQDSDGIFSSCEMYSQPQMHLLLNRSQEAANGSEVKSCDQGWEYDHSTFISTTVTQWDLVCEKKGLNQASATFFFMGLTVGSVLCGYLSDRFGRRKILLLSFLVSTLFGVLSAFSVSYLMFSVSRFLCGVGLMGMTLISITLALEWTDVAHRTFCGTISSLSWTLGYMLLALLGYLIRDWRWLLLVVTSPCLLAVATWWWVPESARWLLTRQESTEAHRYLARCAQVNGRPDFNHKISPEALQKTVTVESRHYSFWDLVKTRQLRKNTLCLGIMWFGVAFSYYGISFNVTGFRLNPFITHFIFGAIEIPAKLGVYLLLDRIGRKLCQGGSLLLTGVFIGLTSLTPTGLENTRSVVAILGKGFSEAAFTTAFLFTAELYPTVLRQTGLGFCSFMTRLGSSVAPLVMLLEDVWLFLPPGIFSGMALISGCAAFFLTETSDLQLPETIQDVELVRNRNGISATNGEVPMGRRRGPSSTTPHPSTSGPSGTTPHPSTSGPSGTTPHPSTSGPSGTTPHRSTSGPSGTTPHPSTSGPSGTTPHRSTSGPSGTTPHRSTSGPSSTTPHPSTSDPSGTSPHPSTSGPSSTTPHPSTSGPSGTTPHPSDSNPCCLPTDTTQGPQSDWCAPPREDSDCPENKCTEDVNLQPKSAKQAWLYFYLKTFTKQGLRLRKWKRNERKEKPERWEKKHHLGVEEKDGNQKGQNTISQISVTCADLEEALWDLLVFYWLQNWSGPTSSKHPGNLQETDKD